MSKKEKADKLINKLEDLKKDLSYKDYQLKYAIEDAVNAYRKTMNK